MLLPKKRCLITQAREHIKGKEKKLLNLKLTIMLIRAIAINVGDQPSGMEFSNALKTKEPNTGTSHKSINSDIA
jgi:hypothetical protein